VIIKVILIAALVAAAYLLLHGRPSALNLLLRRTLMLLAICCGVVAVLVPEAVTAVAHVVGVGRGADLLLYLACVTFLFTTIGLHLRLASLRDQYVALAREIAIDRAAAAHGDLPHPHAARPVPLEAP
jgi:hypothetical protein